MMTRGFYHTQDKDEVPIDFGHQEEKDAFETALSQLKVFPPLLNNCLYAISNGLQSAPTADTEIVTGYEDVAAHVDNEGRILITYQTSKGNKPMFTTLQAEQTSRHSNTLRRILGVHVCNIHSRDSWNIMLSTNYRWDAEKEWVKR